MHCITDRAVRLLMLLMLLLVLHVGAVLSASRDIQHRQLQPQRAIALHHRQSGTAVDTCGGL